jgi:WW domain-containing oxidoreductase
LVNGLSGIVRDGTGRIVIVSSNASIKQAPAEGIMFDNLDGQRSYRPFAFYGQSKLAAALYAKELSRRLAGRGIAVNSLHPGATKGTRLNKYLRGPLGLVLSVAKLFMRNAQRGAATQALLAASPRVASISGEYWTDCQIAEGNPLLHDNELARRLWDVSERIVAAQGLLTAPPLQAAA